MSTNWMQTERALVSAERRLVRRLCALAWLTDYHRAKWPTIIGVGRKWTRSSLRNTAYPGWIDRDTRWVVYDDIMFLAMEAETLVLRLRALKFYGATSYLDLQHISTLTVRDFIKRKYEIATGPR